MLGGGESGRLDGDWDGGGCCSLKTYSFENFPRLLYFTPWKFQVKQTFTPWNSTKLLHSSEILRYKTKSPGNFTWFFLDHPCNKFHIVFNKSLEILLTIPSIPLENPILLILFLFSNMVLSKTHTPKWI